MLLRFGYVFFITILAGNLAPDPLAHALKTFFQYPTHQKYDIVDDKNIRKSEITHQKNEIEQNLNRADL